MGRKPVKQAGCREFSVSAATPHEDFRNHIRRQLIQRTLLAVGWPNRITVKKARLRRATASEQPPGRMWLAFRDLPTASMSSETVNPDHLAAAVNAAYTSLKYKPPIGQYTILAGFILVSPQGLQVISLATGSKCLPASRLSRRGESVNDSHAEILARRGALLWFFDEVHRMRNRAPGEPEPWLEKHPAGKYQLRDMVHIHMYISTVPCTSVPFTVIMYSIHKGGDASMRFLANSQDPEMAQLKDSAPFEAQPPNMPWRGRNNYHCYGVLRTKPGRADSPATASMSCSDKIAAWNVLGLQGALGSLFFMPLYVDSIIIGEAPLDIRDVVLDDCRRAFWERIEDLEGNRMRISVP